MQNTATTSGDAAVIGRYPPGLIRKTGSKNSLSTSCIGPTTAASQNSGDNPSAAPPRNTFFAIALIGKKSGIIAMGKAKPKSHRHNNATAAKNPPPKQRHCDSTFANIQNAQNAKALAAIQVFAHTSPLPSTTNATSPDAVAT